MFLLKTKKSNKLRVNYEILTRQIEQMFFLIKILSQG